MIGRYLLCCLLVYIGGCQSSQRATEKLSLWAIESMQAKVYLMGSVHALTEQDYPLPREFEEAFNKSDTLVVEVNLNTVDQAHMHELLRELGHFQEGDIRSRLSDETMASLVSFLDATHQPLESYLSVKPWLIALQVSSQRLRLAGYDPQLGVDKYFLNRAQDTRRILELESAEQQLRLLADQSPVLQDKALCSSLKSMDSLVQDLDSLISAWSSGDAEGMYEIALDSVSDEPALSGMLAQLLDTRNQQMADRIRGYLSGRGTYLVIVGALHMGGERGLIKLLGTQYRVRQIERGNRG